MRSDTKQKNCLKAVFETQEHFKLKLSLSCSFSTTYAVPVGFERDSEVAANLRLVFRDPGLILHLVRSVFEETQSFLEVILLVDKLKIVSWVLEVSF
jgi:hypothetical protein